MASNPNPFASDTSSLRAMLQNAFAAMPQGGGQLEQMALPTWRREAQDPIDLGAGGPAPGQGRSSFLGSLGGLVSQAGQIAGAAMAARGAKPTKGGAWNNSALGNTPRQITAPQLGPAAPFSTAGLNQSLSAPSLNLSLGRQLVPPPFSLGGQ